jgi:hypothetical protein
MEINSARNQERDFCEIATRAPKSKAESSQQETLLNVRVKESLFRKSAGEPGKRVQLCERECTTHVYYLSRNIIRVLKIF